MKSFTSIAEATRAAAEVGATLQIGGRTINAGGATLSVVRRPPAATPQPEPAPGLAPEPAPPAAAPAQIDITPLANALDLQARMAAAESDALARAMSAIVAALPQPAQSLPPRYPVAFDIEHNEMGRLKRIIPIYED